MSILDRYLLRELISAWLIGLAVFVGFLMVGEVFRKGIELLLVLKAPISDVLRWFFLALPNLIGFSLPMATLLSVVMTVGRMSYDLEITAFLSSGISFRRLLFPVGIMSFGVSIVSFWLNAFITPPTYGVADSLLWKYRGNIQTIKWLFVTEPEPKKGPPHLILSAYKFNPKVGELENIWLFEMTGEEERVFLQAKKAIWQNNRWEFHNGFIQIISKHKPLIRKHFDILNRPTMLRSPVSLTRDHKQGAPNRLTLPALNKEIRRMMRWNMPKEVISEYFVERHNRFALAISCFVLAMLGAPVALWLRRGGGVAVAISVVLTLFYYFAWNIGSLLGKSGWLPPAIGSHIANLIGLACWAWLLFKLR